MATRLRRKVHALISFPLINPDKNTARKGLHRFTAHSSVHIAAGGVIAGGARGNQSCCTNSKKQRERDTCFQPAFSFLFSPGLKLREWFCLLLV